MRPNGYSLFCLVQCARRMCTKSELNTVRTEYNYKKKAFNIGHLVTTDMYINKKLANDESVEDNQWGKVRKELLQKFEHLNEINVDSQVYDICSYYKRLDQSINYYEFLERNEYPLNLSTMTTYLKLMNQKQKNSLTPLTKEEEKNIIKVYKKIRKEYELLDPRSASFCIAGLSLTSEWEECFKLLEMIKFIQTPTTTEMSAIIAAALRNDRGDMALKMIDEFLINQPLSPFVYVEYLDYCKRNFKRNKLVKEIEKIFFSWQKYTIVPQESVILAYEEFFKSIGYTTKKTSITKGICQHCNMPLQPTVLSKTDFRVLSSAILKNLIVGKDVYRNTSPQELKNYMIFLQSMKPYDVIIDGLNVAYATRGVNGNMKGSIENVLQVVNYFHQRKKRVLVVGRVHMKWWSTKEIKILEDSTDVFYIKNISQDDPFLLHLTLSSGSETCFVSRDLMRQHKFKLEDPTLKKLFRNWQMSHQYFFYSVPEKRHIINIVEPIQYDPCAQKSDEGWHIPYTTSNHLAVPAMYKESPQDWLCMKNRKQEKC
ncbi:mitochondrial ribonuclease P catalytic subunit [Phymastichus coffea]|uniref:mitochondrial ribonuclease P catalytic subunit n=1 Tax=Phymastichus coffea TaxID=108790 RepID=UPI00273AA4A0|nr:mitochondrial ribonuclease P catalytic subunit [Phymastichus coffea]